MGTCKTFAILSIVKMYIMLSLFLFVCGTCVIAFCCLWTVYKTIYVVVCALVNVAVVYKTCLSVSASLPWLSVVVNCLTGHYHYSCTCDIVYFVSTLCSQRHSAFPFGQKYVILPHYAMSLKKTGLLNLHIF